MASSTTKRALQSGARNQGWKDSGNGIVMEDGQLAEPPIALPEVQGYVYLAWSSMAELFERDGDSATARAPAPESASCCTRASTASSGCRTSATTRSAARPMAASRGASLPTRPTRCGPASSIRSMRGLWFERVCSPDMFSGWGVRTLSATDPLYNPVDYQVGSVWPHDNAIIVAGMQRYGFDKEANQVFTAMMLAASKFEHFRLPEVFAGYEPRLRETSQ